MPSLSDLREATSPFWQPARVCILCPKLGLEKAREANDFAGRLMQKKKKKKESSWSIFNRSKYFTQFYFQRPGCGFCLVSFVLG